MRLDRLISRHFRDGRRPARGRLASGLVRVNGMEEKNSARQIGAFDRITVDNQILQNRTPRYVALNKPSGHVSATADTEHPTVIDLIDAPWAGELHLAGRLDRFTTGLVILTNDSRFSESLTLPDRKVSKTYRVETDEEIPPETVTAFEAGMPFARENMITTPAVVEMLDPRRCRLTIYEGKHHQVKRMFARFDIKVTALHRESVGPYALDGLAPGAWREISV